MPAVRIKEGRVRNNSGRLLAEGQRSPDRGATTSRCRDIGEEEQQRDGRVPPQPFGQMGVAGDLFVSRRRRCPCIASSSVPRPRLASPIRKRYCIYEREYLIPINTPDRLEVT